MTGAQGLLIEALIAGLQADAGARAVLGDPVRVWDQPPRGAVAPYVQIGRCDSRPVRAEGGAVEHLVMLNCVSRFAGMEEARAVAAAVEAALETGTLAADGLTVVSCEVRGVEVRRSADLGRAYAVMRLRVVTD